MSQQKIFSILHKPAFFLFAGLLFIISCDNDKPKTTATTDSTNNRNDTSHTVVKRVHLHDSSARINFIYSNIGGSKPINFPLDKFFSIYNRKDFCMFFFTYNDPANITELTVFPLNTLVTDLTKPIPVEYIIDRTAFVLKANSLSETEEVNVDESNPLFITKEKLADVFVNHGTPKKSMDFHLYFDMEINEQGEKVYYLTYQIYLDARNTEVTLDPTPPKQPSQITAADTTKKK
jgi:hypothetical protein